MKNWNIYLGLMISNIAGVFQASNNMGYYNIFWIIPILIVAWYIAENNYFGEGV